MASDLGLHVLLRPAPPSEIILDPILTESETIRMKQIRMIDNIICFCFVENSEKLIIEYLTRQCTLLY